MKYGLIGLAKRLVGMLNGGSGDDDDYMTANKALSYAPVWYAVNKIAGHVGRLPLNLHQEKGRENVKIKKHLGYRTLRVRPNAFQTPFVFKRQITAHALLWGNGRAAIHRDGMRTELIPLLPDRCETHLINGEKVHFYKPDRDERFSFWDDVKKAVDESIQTGLPSSVMAFGDSEVLHIHGLGFDGVSGQSLISLASQSWGLGIGAEAQERARQKRGYAGGLMLEAPQGALRNEDEAKRFLDHFRKNHDGEENAGRTGLLREGITASAKAMSNADAQFIEQRKFQRQEAALWFLLEQILGDDSSVSYKSLEQKNLAYLQNCLGSWLTTWEEECEAKLLTEIDVARGFYFKFNDGALLRSDKVTTATTVSTLIRARVINPNEGRDMFDLNPYQGGDSYENPSITPGPAGGGQERRAIESRLEGLVRVEANRAKAGAVAKNFVDWLDGFYPKWQKTLAKAIEDLGGDGAIAEDHCEQSKAELLACADVATSIDDLKKAVAKCVANWTERVATLADELEAMKC
jgi:HK97 family phage portal protein